MFCQLVMHVVYSKLRWSFEMFLSCLFTPLTFICLICVLQMYIRCTVNLCITTMPSQKCPDLCSRNINQRSVVGSLFTSSYTIDSGPVSLVVTTAAPTTTRVAINTGVPVTTPQNTTSHGKMLCSNQAPMFFKLS